MTIRTTSAKFRGVSGAVDQVFSSLSNGIILYAVAVVSTAEFFGLISVQLTLLAAALGCIRGGLGTALLLKAGQGQESIRIEGAYAITFALIISPVIAGILWLLGGANLGGVTLLIALATPVVLVQDVLRYVVIAEGRPHIAAIWDGVWLMGSIGLLVCTWLGRDFVQVSVLVGGWAALAGVALLGLAINIRIVPRVRGFSAWLRTDWQHRLRFGIDSGLDQGSIFVMLAAVAILVNPVVAAALRGAAALLAPVSMLTSSIPLILIPESARRSSTPKEVWKQLIRISVLASVACMSVGIVLHFLPDSIGSLLLGNTFALTQEIILMIAFEYSIVFWSLAIVVWLKTFNRSRSLLRMKILYVTLLTGLPIGAAVTLHSSTGVAAALVVASTLVATVSLAWFAPWRGELPKSGTPADDRPKSQESRAKGTPADDRPKSQESRAKGKPPGWHHKVASKSGFGARPSPDFVRLDAHRPGPVGTSSLLFALWVFAVMGILGPLLIIALTGPAPNGSWVGALIVAVVAAARFSWLMGLGERRLFETMFWSFTYPFMGLAPLTELREQVWPIITPRSDFSLAWPAITIVMVGCASFLLGVFVNRSRQMRTVRASNPLSAVSDVNETTAPAQAFTVDRSRVLILAFLAIAANLYYSYRIGWIQFAQTRVSLNEAMEKVWPSPTLAIIVRAGVYMTLLTSWVALMRFRREAKLMAIHGRPQSTGTMRLNLLLLWVVGILLANSMNPISNARYLSGTAILAMAAGFGLYATSSRFRFSAVAFLASLLVLFPIMDAFRYNVTSDLSDVNPLRAFLTPDYDSFANIVNGYLIVQREGLDVGKQFMGVVLFWVPRMFWSDKPVDTGIFIARSRGYPVTNLSAPLWVEMYMNGGFLLLIVAMFALGYWLHSWDTRLDQQIRLTHMPTILGAILPFYMFILLRGSLLQAMPYLMVTIVSWLFVRSRRNDDHPRRRAGPRPRSTSLSPRARPRERQAAHV